METVKCKCMEALDWNLLREFHATATTVPLSDAAGQLGLTRPKLSRQVAALEASLWGCSSGRSLTPTGAELRDRNLAAPGRG